MAHVTPVITWCLDTVYLALLDFESLVAEFNDAS